MKTAIRLLLPLAALTLSLGGCVDMEGLEADASEDVSSTAAPILSTAAPVFTELELLNGWQNVPGPSGRNAGVALVSNTVRFKGWIEGGDQIDVFILPSAFRPATDVYVPVDLCDANPGMLHIFPNGLVSLSDGYQFWYTNGCFSLEGASFDLSSSGFTPLDLDSWFWWSGTSEPAAKDINGIVHFKGAIGRHQILDWHYPFTLPSELRPQTTVYVPVSPVWDRGMNYLQIDPDGVVTIDDSGLFGVSLDGVWFARDTSSFTALSLQNGWTVMEGTSAPGVQERNGVVHFKGAIKGGSTGAAFTLPSNLRPKTTVYVPVPMYHGAKGRLAIQPSGDVFIERPAGTNYSFAQNLTSLDGASFALSDFTPLALENGWTNTQYATADASVSLQSGIVHFKGAIVGGASSFAFTLPEGFRPAARVYVPVELCGVAKGRLRIEPDGQVFVKTQTGAFSYAQCFTSLEGASFVLSPVGSTALVLENGWTHAPFGTRDAAVAEMDGTIRFTGAIAGGTTGVAFTLPARLRPPADVYIPVNLCDATKGRLEIQTNGVVTVHAENTFSDAQCFTSLEGASFELSSRSWPSTPLALNHGWTNAPSGTRAAAVKSDRGHIRFEGAIANGTTTTPFTLPNGFRPAANVYVPVDLCDAAKGRLKIEPNGTVTVQAEGASSAAQCFTSLEGVSFAL